MDHPWRRFRDQADWLLRMAELPGDLVGYTDFVHREVVLDSRLLQSERRCTIAHELEHIHRGPPPADGVLLAREELAIDKTVARRLISIEALGEALAWSLDLHEAAEELWVDVPTLRVRLEHLHPAERHYLQRRLEHHRASP